MIGSLRGFLYWGFGLLCQTHMVKGETPEAGPRKLRHILWSETVIRKIVVINLPHPLRLRTYVHESVSVALWRNLLAAVPPLRWACLSWPVFKLNPRKMLKILFFFLSCQQDNGNCYLTDYAVCNWDRSNCEASIGLLGGGRKDQSSALSFYRWRSWGQSKGVCGMRYWPVGPR